MGCPKHFSVHSGMGVALIKDSERACSIVRALRAALDIPVSCKIRLLNTVGETVDFVRALEAAGAQAIGVHARTASMRPNDAPHWNQLQQIVQAVSVPVIVNGDVWGPAEAQAVQALSGCSSVMSARGALKNLRVCFESDVARAQKEMENKDSIIQVIHDYVRIAIDYDNHGKNTKYVIQYMLKMNNRLGSDFGKAVSSGKCRTMCDIARVCGLSEYYQQAVKRRQSESGGSGGSGASEGSSSSAGGGLGTSRAYSDDFFYARPKKRQRMVGQPGKQLPPEFKKILVDWGELQTTLPRKQQCPQYQHVDVATASEHFDDVAKTSQAQCYKAVVHVGGQTYAGEWAKSKSQATSKAAHSALVALGVDVDC